MEFECEFSKYLGEYTCTAFKPSITEPNIEILGFKGDHLPGKSHFDVNRVIFSNDNINYFPRNLYRIFPNLNFLEIHNCHLKEISREDLVGLEKLVWLNLSSNHLKSLPDDLFSNMPKLKKVCLNYNKIEFASSKLIEPIVGNQLERFQMRNNASIDESYWSLDRHSGCRTVQELMARIDKKCKIPEPQVGLKIFNELRLKGRNTDFVITVGLKEFPVHKNVLASQSSVLAEMFEVKQNGRFAIKLEISDLSAEAVEAFLDYLYERKLPESQNVVEVFKLAAKYVVPKLKSVCEQIIIDNINKSNANAIFELAAKYNPKLKSICEQIILDNLNKLNAFEIFKLACGPQKSEILKVAAFGKLQELFGSELGDDLINKPKKLKKIIKAKKICRCQNRKRRSKFSYFEAFV